MADKQDSQEKTEEPSQHRIEEFRRKGEVAASKELSSVLVLSACILTLILSSLYIFEVLNDLVNWIRTLKTESAFLDKQMEVMAQKAVETILKGLLPLFLVSFCAGILAQVGQIGFLYAPEVLSLKFDRINPVNGVKKLFSKKSLGEAVKGILKFTMIISISWTVMLSELDTFNGFFHTEVLAGFGYAKYLFIKMAVSILLGMIVVGVADFAWEKYLYRQKLKMSKQEMKEESKEKEGNPEVKQKIRSIQKEMAQKRMLNDVKDADAVVTNPTHLSVAVKYDPENMAAPQVVAKGEEHLALRIRELAKDFEVPVVENVPLARSLYRTVEVGDNVPRELYKAVAQVLAFVYKLRRKKEALAI